MSSDLLTSKPVRHENAITTILPDGHVAVIQLGATTGFTLCPAGAILWELCDGNLSVKEAIETVDSLMLEATNKSNVPLDAGHLQEQMIKLVNDLIAQNYLNTSV